MITGIRRICIDVSSMPQALAFFVDQLGLPVLREIGSRAYPNRWEMGFDVKGTTVAIVEPKPAQGPIQPGRVTVVFETDDIEADYEALKAKGTVFTVPPTWDPFEGETAYFEGPDGVTLGLVEPNRDR